jgi:hypothetical protein
MHAWPACLALIVAAAAALPKIGHAETVAETVRAWGLLGTWSPVCSDDPSPWNGRYQYFVTSGGRVGRVRDLGSMYDRKEVKAAHKHADELELVVYCPKTDEWREIRVVKGEDGRLRVMADRNLITEEYVVKDGMFTSSRTDTPWKTRCSR